MSTPGKNPDKSSRLFERALELLPGGVNSPVRAFRGVGGTPLFIQSASGATITDVDGRSFIDYVCSWGPMILGHADADAKIVAALAAVAASGTSFGAPPTNWKLTLAEKSLPPCLRSKWCAWLMRHRIYDSAIRLARA